MYSSHSKYEPSSRALTALTAAAHRLLDQHWRPGGYLERVTKTLGGIPIGTHSPSTHGSITTSTRSRRWPPGGDAISADIGNWNLLLQVAP